LLLGAALAQSPAEPLRQPISGMEICDDQRYPALAGPWAVGCDATGAVRVAIHVETGERVTIAAGGAPALADGLVYAPGIPSRVWRLPAGKSTPEAAIPGELIGPPATDGEVVVVPLADGLVRQALGDNRRQAIPGEPAPWYPPAVTGEWTVWVSLERGEEVIEAHEQGAMTARRLDSHAENGGHPRHVAASEGWLGWIRDDEVVLWHPEDGERRIPTDAHTSRGLSMWGGVACWESWNGEDVDIACSDGVQIARSGHQRAPSRWGDWLLYVDDRDRVMIVEVAAP